MSTETNASAGAYKLGNIKKITIKENIQEYYNESK